MNLENKVLELEKNMLILARTLSTTVKTQKETLRMSTEIMERFHSMSLRLNALAVIVYRRKPSKYNPFDQLMTDIEKIQVKDWLKENGIQDPFNDDLTPDEDGV